MKMKEWTKDANIRLLRTSTQSLTIHYYMMVCYIPYRFVNYLETANIPFQTNYFVLSPAVTDSVTTTNANDPSREIFDLVSEQSSEKSTSVDGIYKYIHIYVAYTNLDLT